MRFARASSFKLKRVGWYLLLAVLHVAACTDDGTDSGAPVGGAGAGGGVAGVAGSATAGIGGSAGGSSAGRGGSAGALAGRSGAGAGGTAGGSAGGGSGIGSAAGSAGAAGGGGSAGAAGGGSGMGGSGGSAGMGGSGGSGATFTAVYSIIMAKCGGGLSGCHVTGNSGGLQMPNKNTAHMNLVGRPSSECNGETRVIANNAENSLLVKALEDRACVDQMPDGRDPLSSAEIMTIRSWIMAGAPNN